jgi:hypothetical protein
MTHGKYAPRPRDAGVRRYYGLGAFAVYKGVPYAELVAGRHSGNMWVPSPDIMIGERGGWSLPCIQHWKPFRRKFVRPSILFFADATEMTEHHHLTLATLWTCIDDGNLAAPVVWVDDQPGWVRQPGASS